MNKVYIKTNSKLKVRYLDLMADKDSEDMTVPLDELFLIALSMNNMGFGEGFETEYIIDKMIEANADVVNVIDTAYKLDLIEAWDYDIIDILDDTNKSVKDTLDRTLNKDVLRIDEENQFEIFKALYLKLDEIGSETFEIALLCLLGVIKHDNVYSALKKDMQNLISSCVN